MDHYVQQGVGELDQEKLPHLLELKCNAVADAVDALGAVSEIRDVFIGFQKPIFDDDAVGFE